MIANLRVSLMLALIVTLAVVMLFAGGCGLLPKNVTDKGADFVMGYCTTVSPSERSLIRSEVNAKLAARAAETGMVESPRVCVDCPGVGDECTK